MSLLDRARYRAGQLTNALRPKVREEEVAQALRVLGPGLFPLFESMQKADQRHCLDVYEALLERHTEDAEMLQAALLHDAGKGSIARADFGVRHRVAYVVLERSRGLLNRAAKYNRGLAGLHAHGRRTVELADEYGASPGVVHLLEQMEGLAPVTDERARRLKDVDDRL